MDPFPIRCCSSWLLKCDWAAHRMWSNCCRDIGEPGAVPANQISTEEESHCRWGTVEEIPSLGCILEPGGMLPPWFFVHPLRTWNRQTDMEPKEFEEKSAMSIVYIIIHIHIYIIIWYIIYTSWNIYIYIHIYIYVCLCVCVRSFPLMVIAKSRESFCAWCKGTNCRKFAWRALAILSCDGLEQLFLKKC